MTNRRIFGSLGGALVLIGALAVAVPALSEEGGTSAHAQSDHAESDGETTHAHGDVDRRDKKVRADLRRARAATSRFHRVGRAEADGFALPTEGPLQQCISSYDNSGAMGFHYINGDFVGDAVVTPTKPEALVYHWTADGRLKLGALEYVVFAAAWDAENTEPPEMFGQDFMLIDEPNRYDLPAFYALHVWLWKHNPNGLLANFNPTVTCHC